MSNFFLGPNFRDKIHMGSMNHNFVPPEELEQQEKETVEQKKAKGDRNGKEQGHDKGV